MTHRVWRETSEAYTQRVCPSLVSSAPTTERLHSTYGEVDLSRQDQEIVVSETTLSIPPGVHQLLQAESITGLVLLEGVNGLSGVEEFRHVGKDLDFFFAGGEL
jgi:hypothetical protein